MLVGLQLLIVRYGSCGQVADAAQLSAEKSNITIIILGFEILLVVCFEVAQLQEVQFTELFRDVARFSHYLKKTHLFRVKPNLFQWQLNQEFLS